MVPATESNRTPGIAIIGIAGRFPKAADVDRFWSNLCDGVEGLTRFTDDEMLAAGIDPALLADPDYVPVNGALEGAGLFASSFFGYSAREALIMDPQQRLFLECAWEALENAGYGAPPSSTGVFAGVSVSTYLLNRLVHRPDLLGGFTDIETTIGTDKDFLASRVAYKLDLRGPAVVVQSACSSSLVAIHTACRALLADECELALAGGSSVDVPQRAGYLYKPEGIYSADGHCRPFDRRASGMVGGSGVGVVILKRLDQAKRDRDTIHAVILGSAINNDGANKVGYSAPGVDGQSAVIARAQAVAGVDSSTIGYVEAHGTGTALGDPIEVAALTQAFDTRQRGYCALGAVKSNVGHLNAAAGVTGLIKTVLVLREGKIPPTLHFQDPNPNIDFDQSPFYVNRELQDWPETGQPRRAGVSAFGMGGTNAHVVMEEPPRRERQAPPAEPGPRLLVLSARLPEELERAGERLAAHLEQHPEIDLGDVSYTLQVGRKAFRHRKAMVCNTSADVIYALRDTRNHPGNRAPETAPPVTFLFPGQGAQYPNMARELYQRWSVFREQFDYCCDALEPRLGADLREVVFSDPDLDGAAERLRQTQLTQCALFAVEYALAQQWLAFGVEPESMTGHSIGEYVAACIAGVFSLDDALVLIAERGRLIQETATGAMLAIPLRFSDVESRLSGAVSLAAINDPRSCVISGSFEAIAEMERKLSVEAIDCQRLQTSHAFHSMMVEPAVAPLRDLLSTLTLNAPAIPFLSNVTGSWITDEDATNPDYWARHLRQPVRFAEGVARLLDEPTRVFLEVGPGTTLTNLVRQNPSRRSGQRVIASLPHPKDQRTSEQSFLAASGDLWSAGCDIDFQRLNQGAGHGRIPLPTYPFDRQRHWAESAVGTAGKVSPAPEASQRLGSSEWAYAPSWRRAAAAETRDLAEAPLVVFGDEKLLGELPLPQGRRIVRVHASGQFQKREQDIFEIDPWEGGHYERLFEEIAAPGELQLLHFWALPGVLEPSSDSPRDPGFDTLLLLARALGRSNSAIDLIVVTDNLYDVTGAEELQPDQATILGPCRVIPLEYSHINCRNVDISRSGQRISAETAGHVIRELALAEEQAVAAWRGPHRWLPAYEPLPLPQSEAASPLLPAGGTFVVTGGLSGMGAALAGHLCVHHQARVALLGRTQLPPRDQWEAFLAAAATDSPATRAIRTVQELEAAGSKILALAADVTNRDALALALDKVRQEFGPIDGVIHAAGVPAGGVIQLKSLEQARSMMAAKVAGTRNLFELLQPETTRFLFLCSSLASELGGFGQVDYCAANAFQDAFATANNGAMQVQAIDWDTWSETGMAVHTQVPAELQAERDEALRLGLKSQEGQALFPRLLASGQARVLISTRELHARLEAARLPPAAEPVPAVAPKETAPDLTSPRPQQSVEYVAPRTPAEQKLAEIWQALFGLDSIGVQDNFFELGGHSLLATQLLNRVRKSHPSAGHLSLAVLFDGPTIEELATHLGSSAEAESSPSLPSLEELSTQTPDQRRSFFHDYLAPRFGEDAAKIVWDLKQDLGLIFYPNELEHASRLEDLVDRVAAAAAGPPPPDENVNPDTFSSLIRRSDLPADSGSEPNPAMVFVLSAPRSGSTLLRLMLAGHPGLFCPPELALLAAPDMTGWAEHQLGFFQQDGLTRALMELHGMDAAQAREQITGRAERGDSIQQVYRDLQTACGDRLLVDKSPAYALDANVLARAESMFSEPLYLVLTRHPGAVIDSIVRHRMDRLLATGDVADPWHFAEHVWASCNQNLERLAATLPQRCHPIRYEQLVHKPEQIMRAVCGFLDIDYHAAMLEPYAGGRMIDGPGDPDIFQHDRIETDLADSWQRTPLPFELQPGTLQLASRLGYQSAQPGERSVDPATAARLLEQVDSLSDEEVEATLRALLDDEEQGG